MTTKYSSRTLKEEWGHRNQPAQVSHFRDTITIQRGWVIASRSHGELGDRLMSIQTSPDSQTKTFLTPRISSMSNPHHIHMHTHPPHTHAHTTYTLTFSRYRNVDLKTIWLFLLPSNLIQERILTLSFQYTNNSTKVRYMQFGEELPVENC